MSKTCDFYELLLDDRNLDLLISSVSNNVEILIAKISMPSCVFWFKKMLLDDDYLKVLHAVYMCTDPV